MKHELVLYFEKYYYVLYNLGDRFEYQMLKKNIPKVKMDISLGYNEIVSIIVFSEEMNKSFITTTN